MTFREIKPGIYWIGSIDWDRRLFDSLIPLPQGTSYNAYLVKGSEKTALIDTVDPTKEYELVQNLVRIGVDGIDYIIVNHAEQDHSGALPMILELFPGARVVTNEKCRDLLVALLDIDGDRVDVIEDNDTLSLGDKTLQFLITPWVHWPETMLTYVQESKVLFSCDLFGSHIATSDLFVSDERIVYSPSKRYYAEIMMPFRSSIKGHMEKLDKLPIGIVAPSHGPLYATPDPIFSAYRDWISDDVKNEVVIPYVSMHGSTEKMVNLLTEALIAKGVGVAPYNLTVTDTGELAMALVDAATVVIATPTVLFGPHPQAVCATYLVNLLRPKMRFASVIGSYGWGGKTVETLKGMLSSVKPELLEPVYIRGAPGAETVREIERLAEDIAKKHREIGILD
ncbi:MAG TPA: FprA family A-type flavoprotein [Methanoregulaceae archaeon]|nr:FprA family A-type flavoprotein [Methanoregulaceae archaeon]MDD5684148.1 FprA family A-type flavoprotein [Methanoregulaceae archaeon]HOP66887.1 FprA family A-type flavoprotein [Methanoregulaceae archaeon]HPJ73960.1 FprA family A-type flavoprotein [Methanoregulaceae archaeon]HPQ75610.1 FprA family A-type flavoprotein [Methanoregulaceae archaeon]